MNGPVLLAGCLVGGGAALLAAWALPPQPHLGDALARLDPDPRDPAGPAPATPGGDADRFRALGAAVRRRLPAAAAAAPAADLRILGTSTDRWLGEKVAYAAIGLLFPSLFTAVMAVLGRPLPLAVPALGGLLLAAVLFTVPDVEVRRRAAAAREQFARAVAAYIDLVAMERRAAGGITQAMETAAAAADSWVFHRIREELAAARYGGRPAWDALADLGEELRVPALTDLGDIMRTGGEHGAAVGDALAARAAAARDAILAADHARANAATAAMAVPTAVVGLVVLVLLGAPALIRIALG